MDLLRKKMQQQQQQQSQGQSSSPPPVAMVPLLNTSKVDTPENKINMEEIKEQMGYLVQAREKDHERIEGGGGAGLHPEMTSVELNSVVALPVAVLSQIHQNEVSVEYVSCRDLPPFLADKNWLSDSVLCMLQQAAAKENGEKNTINLRLMTTRVAAAKVEEPNKKQFRNVLGRSGSPLMRQMNAQRRMVGGAEGNGVEDTVAGGLPGSGLRNIAVPRNGGRPGSQPSSPRVGSRSNSPALLRAGASTPASIRSGSPLMIPRQYDETDVGEAFATLSMDSRGSSDDGQTYHSNSSSPSSSNSNNKNSSDFEALYRSILPANYVVLEVDAGRKGPSTRDMLVRFGPQCSAHCITTDSDGAVATTVPTTGGAADAEPSLVTMSHRVKALGGKYGVSERRTAVSDSTVATDDTEAMEAGCILWIALPYNATGAPHSSVLARWNRSSPLSSTSSTPRSPSYSLSGKSNRSSPVQSSTSSPRAGVAGAAAAVPTLAPRVLRSVASSEEMIVHDKILTARSAPTPRTARAEAAPEQEDPVLVAISKLHVLAVDDAPSVLKRVQLLLCKRGATMVCVPGGDEAVDAISASLGDFPAPAAPGDEATALPPVPPSTAASNRKFDLIFMDRMMPGIDGCEATRRIRAIEQDTARNPAKHRCIIFGMSANTEDLKAREEFFSSGIDAFIPKPFGFADFRSAFEEVTSKTTNADAATGDDKDV